MRFLFLAATLLSLFSATAQPRFTDSTFGSNGKIIQNTSLPTKYVTDVMLQPDGKSVTLAEAQYNTKTRVVLIRYNIDGTLDNTFSNDGIADSLLDAAIDFYPLAMKLQPDGKILLCGYTVADSSRAFVIRYNINGSLDASFGNNGLLYLPYFFVIGNSTINVSGIRDLVVLPGNKIMLMSSRSGEINNLVMIRLNTNGTLDNSFGTNGTVGIHSSPEYVGYTKMLLQSDGKFIMGGNIYNILGAAPSVALARVNPNGTLDATYGINGFMSLNAGPAFSKVARDMAMQADNKIVISGIGKNEQNIYEYAFVARVNANGTQDITYGNNGIQYLLRTTAGFISPEGQISLQQDGKALLAGNITDTYGSSKMAVTRLTNTGSPDATFDGDGIAQLQINQHFSFGIATVQQTNGNIIVSGYANNNDAASAAIARLYSSGQTDNTVATATNIAYIGSGQDYETGLNVHIQPADQKIVDITERYNGVTYDLRVSRYLPNGTPDNTFGTSGHTIIEMPGAGYQTHSTLLSNGKVLLVTLRSEYTAGYFIELVRVNTNGFIDSSFGLNGKLLLTGGSTYGLSDNLKDVAFQVNDKVVLLTNRFDPATYIDSTFLVRLNADGSPDLTLNGTGRKYLPYLPYNTDYQALDLQLDNKIIIAENRDMGNGYAIVVTRYNLDGSLDNTYNTNNTSLSVFSVLQMKVLPDNKVVLTPYFSTDVFRFTSTGNLDNTFGINGALNVYSSFPNFDVQGGIYIQDSGKLLLTGVVSIYQTVDTVHAQIIRLQSNGHPDTSFGVNGAIRIDGLGNITYDNPALAFQTDGKVVFTGYKYDDAITTSYGDAVLTRLKPTASTTGRLYTFTGSGLWSNPSNWADGILPPTTIPAGSSIVIDPSATGECVIDNTVHVQTGASVIVKAGKKVRLPGNLIIQ